MAEQQLTQEQLGQEQLSQEQLGQEQMLDAQMPVEPEPKPKKTEIPAPAMVPEQKMFGGAMEKISPLAQQKIAKEEKVLPKQKEEPPVFLGDLRGAEQIFKDFATFDEAEKSGATVASSMIGMGAMMQPSQNVFPTQAAAEEYMAGIKRNKIQSSAQKNQTIQQITDGKLFQKLTDNIFGSPEDIIKHGGKVNKFITKNSAGQDIIDPGLVRKELDKIVSARGNNGGRYMKEFFGSRVLADDNLDVVLSMFKNRDKINKAMPTGIPKDQIRGFITEFEAKNASNLKSQINTQDKILDEKVKTIQQKYSTEITDAGVDYDVYMKAAADEVAKEMEGIYGIYDPALQESYQRRVKERFDEKYSQYVMPKFQDITDRMTADIKVEVAKVNNVIKRIYKERNEILSKELQAWSVTKNKELSDKFNKEVGSIIEQGVKSKREESTAYAENMINMSGIPGILGTAVTGKILGDTFTSAVGAFKNKTALILNGLGYDADFIDEMRYSGKSTEVKYSMEKLPLEQNWMKPGYWAQSLAQSAPTMAIGMMTTALTRNPYIGGIVSFLSESVENSGGVMERVLENTGDLNAASIAGGQTFIKNAPAVLSDILFQRMFSPLKVAKGTMKEKVKDLGVGMFAEGITERWQTAIEMSTGPDAQYTFGRAFGSNEAFNAQIEGAVSAGILGGGSVSLGRAYKALFDKKNISSVRTQAIATTILTSGQTAAIAGVQLQALSDGVDDDTLGLGIKEVADVAKIIEDAQQIGLNPQQTQVFASLSKELADLNTNLNTVTDPSVRKALQTQIAAKDKEIEGVISGKTPIATIELQPGLAFTGTVDGVRNVMNVPEVKAEVEAGNVNIITDDQGLNTEVEQARTAPTRKQNIISDTGEIIGQVPAEAAPVAEAAPANTVEDIERNRQAELSLTSPTISLDIYGSGDLGEWTIGKKTKTRKGEDAVELSREVNDGGGKRTETQIVSIKDLNAAINAKYDAELASLQTIKTQEDATQISERAQQEVAQPSNIVQPTGVEQGQPQVGQTTQPAADTRNRNLGSQEEQIAATAKALDEADISKIKLPNKVGVEILELKEFIDGINKQLSKVKDIKTFGDYLNFFIKEAVRNRNNIGLLRSRREKTGTFGNIDDIYNQNVENVNIQDLKRKIPNSPVSAVDIIDQVDGKILIRQGDVINEKNIKKLIDNGIGEVDILKDGVDMDTPISQDELFDLNANLGNIIKDAKTDFSEAYVKAKADGSNPELVKAVEDLIGQPTAPMAEAAPVAEAAPAMEAPSVEETGKTEPITKPEIEYSSRNLPSPIGEFDVVEVIPYTKPEANKFAPDQQLKFNQGNDFEPVRIVGDSELIELIQIGARIRNNLSAKTKKPIDRERQQILEEKYGITATKANRRARELAKENRGNIENIIIIGEKPIAPSETQLDELVNLDVKEPGNLEKIYNWLDNADKALGKQIKPGKLFDIGSAAGAGAIATAQAIVKALKAAVSATVSLKDAIAKVAKDFNISDNEVLNAIKIATDEQAKITKASAKASSIEKQIKDFAKGAKDAISTWRKASEALGNDIKAMVKDGTITTKQAANIIKKFGKTNILSPKAVSKFVDYMTKVFSDAEYQNKLDGARSLKKDIAKLAKGKDRDARLKDIGKRFLKVEPTEVEDIDEYNIIAEQLKESLRGTRRTKTGIELASIINIDDVGGYIQKAIDAQDIKMREDTAKEFQELFGVDPAEFSYDDMLELMETKGEVPKKNEAIIRSAINKAFGIYSTVIKKTIANGVDPFTEAPVEISESKKELLQRFMNMDLGRLDIKLAMQAVDALNNFVTNKSIAKMDAVVSQYEGGLGAKQVNDKNIKSVPLKKLFSPSLGRAFAQYTTNLGALFERMFKGVNRGGFVETKSGISKMKRGKATAETRANNIANDYVTEYYKKGKYGVMFKNVNGEEFNTLKNNVERGVIAFLSRNVIGTKAQREAEFNRRKRHFLQSIDALMSGTKQEKKLGEIYKEISDKLGISDAADSLSIFSKADENNKKGVNFWREKWDGVFDEFAEVSEGIYNKILGKDTDYIPDRYKRLTGQPKQDELTITESAFHYNAEDIYKKEAGVLMKAERPSDLPPGTYIDLSFDNNNASSMYDALIDIHTAAAIRQWEGFSKSPEFNQIINAEDRELFRDRISLYIKKIRNKAPFVDDELEKGVRRLNNLAAVGVGQALGGITAPAKQILGVIPNTFINAGSINLRELKDKDKNAFISRSGYSIANRGVESQAQLDSLNKIIEVAANSNPEKAMRLIEKANNFWLKKFLVNQDAWIARVSWLAYYKQSLEKQGINIDDIDWATHQVNEEAGDYAQRMVDRQQNISDPAEAGKLFANSENSIQKLIVKMAMPFSSFRMNQSTRLANDLSVLGHLSIATKEDREIAARSLAGLAAEMVTFRMVSIGLSLLTGYASYAIMGESPDEEDMKKWKNNIYKGQATNTVTDLFSPLPMVDRLIQEGAFIVAEEIQNLANISEEDQINIFKPKAAEYLENLGLLGITAQRGKQLIDIVNLSMIGNGFEDNYGNERFLVEKDKEALKNLFIPALFSSIGVLPSEVNSVVRKSLNDAKKRALTEKQIRAGGKRKRGGGGGFGTGGLGDGGGLGTGGLGGIGGGLGGF